MIDTGMDDDLDGWPHNAVFVVWGIPDFDSITLTHSSQNRA
jgi:hypothetical protein